MQKCAEVILYENGKGLDSQGKFTSICTKNGITIFLTTINEKAPSHLFLREDFRAAEDLTRFRRGCRHYPESEEQRAVQSKQPDQPLLRIRQITLCSRMGLKSGCLQRQNVAYRKHCVWGYCSSGSTQLFPLPNWFWLQLAPVSGRCQADTLRSLEGHISAVVPALGQINPGTVVSAPTAPSPKAAPALEQDPSAGGLGLPIYSVTDTQRGWTSSRVQVETFCNSEQ